MVSCLDIPHYLFEQRLVLYGSEVIYKTHTTGLAYAERSRRFEMSKMAIENNSVCSCGHVRTHIPILQRLHTLTFTYSFLPYLVAYVAKPLSSVLFIRQSARFVLQYTRRP